MNTVPTLFLDFDGVLHPQGCVALDEDFRLLQNPELFCWRGILADVLRPSPATRIIVSSDWRRLFDDENLIRLLGPALGHRFAGVVETFSSNRADEVLTEAARRGLSNWIAVDDHPSVAEARRNGDKRFVVCNPDTGLSNPSVIAELDTWAKLSKSTVEGEGAC